MNYREFHLDYRPDIDGLRAIAVILVLGFHFFPNIFGAGFIGVDIFFVISGFLITKILTRNISIANFSIIDFYRRRIRRLFPALLTVLIACMVFGWIALTAEEYQALGKHSFAGVGFFSNLLLWSESSYFDVAADKKILLHLWSLGIEEQFYIVWPFMLYILCRLRVNLPVAILLVLLCSFSFNLVTAAKNELVELFFSPLTRVWELLIGAFVSILNVRSKKKPSEEAMLSARGFVFKHKYQSWCGLLLIILSLLLIDKDLKYPGVWAIFPTIGAALLISSSPSSWVNKTLLSNRALVWIGLISYPLYLWHWPLFAFANTIQGEQLGVSLKLLLIVSSVLLAWLTFLYIEKPIRSSRQKKVISWMVVLALLVGAFGIWVYKNNGISTRNAANPYAQLQGGIGREAYLDYIVKNFAACANTKLKESSSNDQKYGYRCFQSIPGKNITTLIVGDSHAEHILPGLARQFTGVNIGSFVQPGMPVQSDVLFTEAYELVKNDPGIKTVILSAFWMEKIPDGSAQTKEALISTLKMLVAANKRVLIMDDVPNFLFDPSRCKYQRIFRFDETQCNIAFDVHVKNKEVYSDVIKAALAAVPEVHYIDLDNVFCSVGKCSMEDGDHLLYRDMHHLNIDGSLYLGEKLHSDITTHIQ